MLKYARKQKQLKELYAEAQTLHAAQKWQAVVKVFEQISAVDSTYPDSEGLLPSAQKEVAELKRLADLNDLYSHAVREMDAGQWYEARRLLEHVHKTQMGYLETERLLRKVEDEIVKVEEHNQRNNQVNVLYEQAHGLLRSKKWRKAKDKMEEIQKLEEQFLDRDGISEKAKTELAREEREAQRQNELAAIYAEAVRLLKEEKYQKALDKWQEVKAIDSKYPDRQWVNRTARKHLLALAKPENKKPQISMSKYLWMGLAGILAIAIVVIVIIEYKNRVTIPKYKVSALDETCPTYATNTNHEGFVSRSSNPVAPWTGIAVNFQGTDNCPNREMLGEASLIYRYRIEFDKVTKLTSITVSGAAFNRPNSILRVLDENKKVLKTVSTSGGNTSQTYMITLEGVKGQLFYIDEFDTSSVWRFRRDIKVNELIP